MKYKKANLNDIIIGKLYSGPVYIPTFVIEISKSVGCSMKAVYNCINNLKDSEVITIHNKSASISLVWLAARKEELDNAEKVYKNIYTLSKAFTMKSGVAALPHRVVRFKFNNISEMDLFWTQAYTILLEHNTNYDAQYLIMAHDFFLYSRPETDNFWLNRNVKNKAITRLVVSHTLSIDKEVILHRRRAHGKQVEYLLYENPLELKSNVYMNVVGDYIFRATFDKKVNQILENKLSQLRHLPVHGVDQQDMQDIVSMKGVFNFSIERNPTKASRMKQKLRKYFVIK